MSLDKYINSPEGLSFTSKRSVLVTCFWCIYYSVQYTTQYIFQSSVQYIIQYSVTLVLDTIYRGQERGCSLVYKSGQPVTWMSRYSLFYSYVYGTAHRTVSSAIYNNNYICT